MSIIIFQPGEDFRLDFPTVDTDGDPVTLFEVEIVFTRVGQTLPFATFDELDAEVTITSGNVALDVLATSTVAYTAGLVCVQITGTTAGGDVDIACGQFTIRGCC